MQCKFCGRDGTVTMIEGKGKPLTQEISESGKYAPLMLFDCRGYEPVDFVFGDGWKVESVSILFLCYVFIFLVSFLWSLSIVHCCCCWHISLGVCIVYIAHIPTFFNWNKYHGLNGIISLISSVLIIQSCWYIYWVL